MTTYHIIHYTNESGPGKTIFSLTYFNKTELETRFYELAKRLKPGEAAEYMKEDGKQFYPSMLYVFNEDGKLYSYTHTGHKRLSKYNN